MSTSHPAIWSPLTADHRNTLQRLRRLSGYRSAHEFAEKLGIPASTYARYERQPTTPESSIPLKQAWKIADVLDVTIDLVVGRTDFPINEPHTLQQRFDALSPISKRELNNYLAYLEYTDRIHSQPKEWR